MERNQQQVLKIDESRPMSGESSDTVIDLIPNDLLQGTYL